MNKITTWIGDIYNKHGWVAALITLSVLVALFLGAVYALDLDAGEWLRGL